MGVIQEFSIWPKFIKEHKTGINKFWVGVYKLHDLVLGTFKSWASH